jgi:hypothetical protein
MLSRVLYAGEDWVMTADWLGLGALYVVNGATKTVTRAHPAQKRFVLGVAEALQAAGVPVHPDNSTARSFLRSIAEDIGTHSVDSFEWTSLFRTGPHRFVTAMLAIEKGQKRDA